MELNTLYDIAEKENIKIYNWQIEDVNGMYLNYHNINAIALNYDNLGTYIDKQEYRAKGFSYKLLIPLEKLRKAISYRI